MHARSVLRSFMIVNRETDRRPSPTSETNEGVCMYGQPKSNRRSKNRDMSPRDRKRDRVLKRRRESKKREREENDDTLEQKYYAAVEERSSSSKKARVVDAQPKETNDLADETQAESTVNKLGGNNCSAPLTKEERQRLKNKERKALRKKKKELKHEAAQEILEYKKVELAKLEALKKKEQEKKRQENMSQDFKSLSLGVKYKDITVGRGPLVQDRKKVRVSYKLRANHRQGKIIDSSPDFRFRVGKGEVIKGWDIGLQGMKEGGVRHLLIPPQAGYGRRNIGAGPGGLLYFEVSLISC